MRYTRLFVFVAIVTVAAMPLIAADPTADLLGAKSVNHFIRLTSLPDSQQKVVIAASVDSFDDATAHSVDGQTFASGGEVSVLVARYNPLTQVWTVEGKTSVDPSYQAITLFLQDLKPLQDTFTPQSEKATMKIKNTAGTAAAAKLNNDDCEQFKTAIKNADTALEAKDITADKLKKYVDEATGYVGVGKARDDLTDAIGNIRKHDSDARNALETLREFVGHDQKPPTLFCQSITAEILIEYVDLAGKAERILTARERLANALEDLVKTSLDPYADVRRWRGPVGSGDAGLTDLAFTTVTPTFDNQVTVTATLKTKSVELGDDSITVKTADSGASSQFLVRRDSFWVPERAAAVIYNHLTYPTYGTQTDPATGKFTVQRTSDTQPVGGAIMLNLIPRFSRQSPVYPMLQVGVSSAKEFPGFLAGLGLRFTAPVAFSISAGGMITRYKDLDRNLHVGDTVTGTDEINKHLQYRTSPIVPYAAIQMKF